MKYFLLLGGFAGFVLAFAASISAGNPASSALLRGGMGCLLGALLLRGLHFVFMVCVRGHIEILAAEARKENATETSDTPAIQ